MFQLKNFDIFPIFAQKHRLWVLVRTASHIGWEKKILYIVWKCFRNALHASGAHTLQQISDHNYQILCSSSMFSLNMHLEGTFDGKSIITFFSSTAISLYMHL